MRGCNNEKPYDVQPTPGPGQRSRRKAHNSCLSERPSPLRPLTRPNGQLTRAGQFYHSVTGRRPPSRQFDESTMSRSESVFQGQVHRVACPCACDHPGHSPQGAQRRQQLRAPTHLHEQWGDLLPASQQRVGLRSSSMQVIDNRVDTQIRLRQPLRALQKVSYQLLPETRSWPAPSRSARTRAGRAVLDEARVFGAVLAAKPVVATGRPSIYPSPLVLCNSAAWHRTNPEARSRKRRLPAPAAKTSSAARACLARNVQSSRQQTYETAATRTKRHTWPRPASAGATAGLAPAVPRGSWPRPPLPWAARRGPAKAQTGLHANCSSCGTASAGTAGAALSAAAAAWTLLQWRGSLQAGEKKQESLGSR